MTEEAPMSYVTESLIPDERVVCHAHIHWSWAIVPVLALVWCMMLVTAATAAGEDGEGMLAVSSFFLMLTLLMGASRALDWATAEMAVTSKRVLAKRGFVRRQAIDLQLAKLESVAVRQGILGRILGYGDVVFSGSGTGKVVLRRIARPQDFKKSVYYAQSGGA